MLQRPVFLPNLNSDQIEYNATFTEASFSTYVSQLTGQPQNSIRSLLESFLETLSNDDPSQNDYQPNHDLDALFLDVIENLNVNGRLGDLLKCEENYRVIKTLFFTFLSIPTVRELLDQLKIWDPYTFYHSLDVFIIGTLTAKHCEISNLKAFSLGCLLHDVGKRLIPQNVLLKKGKLTEAEFQLVQQHAHLGSVILGLLGFQKFITEIAYYHHERMNGTGYPSGMDKNKTKLEWRLITVVDNYSALTLQRTYRDPLSPIRALEIILGDQDSLCEHCAFSLAEALQIFPPQAELVLPNGSLGTPGLPFQKEKEEAPIKIHETAEKIATNHAHTPIRMIGWKRDRVDKREKELWQSFITSLIHNDPKAILYFEELADGKRVEAIYLDILGKVGQELRELVLSGHFSDEQISTALQSCLAIMNQKLVEYAPSYQVSLDKGMVIIPIKNEHTFALRLLHDSLFVNGWRTYFLKSENEPIEIIHDRLEPLIKKDYIHYVALALTDANDLPLIDTVIKLIHFIKPTIKIILYSRTEDLFNQTETARIHFHSSQLKPFLHFLQDDLKKPV